MDKDGSKATVDPYFLGYERLFIRDVDQFFTHGQFLYNYHQGVQFGMMNSPEVQHVSLEVHGFAQGLQWIFTVWGLSF